MLARPRIMRGQGRDDGIDRKSGTRVVHPDFSAFGKSGQLGKTHIRPACISRIDAVSMRH
jgi:hypothetical protein